MPRHAYKTHPVEPDLVHHSVTVSKLINHIMKGGKKTIARKILYQTMDILKEKAKKDPLEILDQAIAHVTPFVEVRSRRVGGATYQVPVEVSEKRRLALAMNWILQAARSQKGKPMAESLAAELLAAYKNEGSAIKRKEDTHRMAEANRAFAHFAK